MDDRLYEALSNPVAPDHNHEPDLNLYNDPGPQENGMIKIKTPYWGYIQDGVGVRLTNEYDIAYTKQGSRGPLVLFLHGVPTNRKQWFPVQRRISRFCRTISIDMLGMGESDKPRNYGKTENDNEENALFLPWDWPNDAYYINDLMKSMFKNEKFFFVADDWGGGIATSYADYFSDRLLGLCLLDPIAFDGYPVSEIQAIGRASMIEDDEQFQQAMGAFDQTLVQIYKTMVYDSSVYNQYNLRDIKGTYIDTDYERNGEDYANSLSLRLNFHAIRVLSDRAAILSPILLLPYSEKKNPKGVKYSRITTPVLIMWGKQDNMMPENQRYRFKWAMYNTTVHLQSIHQAGHFAATDKPNEVAEGILNFIMNTSGKNSLADVFIGFDGIWKGDEEEMIHKLRKLFLII